MKRTKNEIDEHKKIWSEPRRKSLTKEIAYGFTRGSGDLTFGWEMPISAVNFGILGVKIGEGIFGFLPQPNQFFRF